MKERTEKLDFTKHCSAKENVKRLRRQVIDWENVFAEDILGKRLLSKIYKACLKLTNEKQPDF